MVGGGHFSPSRIGGRVEGHFLGATLAVSVTFRVPADIASRRATHRLMAIAGVQGFASWILVQARIATEAPDGNTADWSAVDWAALGMWPAEANVFISALVDSGLVVAEGAGWVPTAWKDEQPHLLHAKARSQQASKAAQARWNRFVQPELLLDARSTQSAMPGTYRSVPVRSDPVRTDPNEFETTGGGGEASPPSPVANGAFSETWPEKVQQVGERLREVYSALTKHDRPTLDPVARKRYEHTREGLEQFDDPAYWVAVDDWLGGDDSQVFYLDEFRAFWAWHVSRSVSQRRRVLKQAFRNWLAKSERWKENDAQREAIRKNNRR